MSRPGTPDLIDAVEDLLIDRGPLPLDELVEALDPSASVVVDERCQAAADPTRREDLRQLLASFDDGGDNPMLMSARRLRTALGLED